VARGQLVPYTITVANGVAVNLPDVTIVDRFPAGFRYVAGSARLDGELREPVVMGRELTWTGLEVTADRRHTLVLLLAVGSGVGEGEFVNRAQAISALTGRALSTEATATVRIVPDPALDCTDVIGKVFDDSNRNGVQDEGETGIPQVRLATARGLLATTDPFGRFHITCAITPHEGRGSNFVLKLDDRTLPSGYRASTSNLQVRRATRGKALEFEFGASIHRVIALDLADAVFEPESAQMRPIWVPRLELLMAELRVAPAVLRLSYLADVEDPQLVEDRLDALRLEIETAWKATENCCAYELAIEPEVFWRRGEPPAARERRRGEQP
jgi:large repetitive protein